jgi:hypothetical protein
LSSAASRSPDIGGFSGIVGQQRVTVRTIEDCERLRPRRCLLGTRRTANRGLASSIRRGSRCDLLRWQSGCVRAQCQVSPGARSIELHDGLVTRIADPGDGRVSRIHLTDRGRSLRDELVPKAVTVNATTLGRLSTSEGRTLRRLLVKLLEGIGDSTSSDRLRPG